MERSEASLLVLVAVAALGLLLVLMLFTLRIAHWRRLWEPFRYGPIPREGEAATLRRRRRGVMWVSGVAAAAGVVVASLGVLGGVAGGSDAWPVAVRVIAVAVGIGIAVPAVVVGAKARALDPKRPFPPGPRRDDGGL